MNEFERWLREAPLRKVPASIDRRVLAAIEASGRDRSLQLPVPLWASTVACVICGVAGMILGRLLPTERPIVHAGPPTTDAVSHTELVAETEAAPDRVLIDAPPEHYPLDIPIVHDAWPQGATRVPIASAPASAPTVFPIAPLSAGDSRRASRRERLAQLFGPGQNEIRSTALHQKKETERRRRLATMAEMFAPRGENRESRTSSYGG